MLTKTSETAVQLMLVLGLEKEQKPISPKGLAWQLKTSPSYTAKITGMLVKAHLLIATKGAKGGVMLARSSDQITLLEIVEACQGRILGDYCEGEIPIELTCAYHQAMKELHDVVTKLLKKWTLADLIRKPLPSPEVSGELPCRMRHVGYKGPFPVRR